MLPSMSPRTYSPGALIHKEEPFVKVLPRQLKDQFCESCHNRCFNLRYCKPCSAVKYCGKACQRKDWSSHRLECKNMKNLTDQKEANVVRLLGRVILKIKGKDWKSIKTSVLGTEVSFDDIDSHYKEMTEDPSRNLLYKELKELTRQFLGPEDTPSDIDMLKIIGKVMYNSLFSSQKDLPGVCFFFGMSVFEHQCIPNSSFMVIENNLKVWANRKIVKGTEKITVSYRRLFDKDEHLLKAIEDKSCNCSDCSLPYGESTLSKILDDKKAFSVISITEDLLRVGSVFTVFGVEPRLKEGIEEVLERHSGVLGRTNLLHLKLLGFRCLELGGSSSEIFEPLTDLESVMRSLFGEFSIEMLRIYEYLAVVYCELGFIGLAASYYSKIKLMTEPF